MGKTREIKKRIKAVGNIRRITKTMQMIATSKFARASAAATATKPYTEGLFNLVTELAATAGEVDH
ncbi:MAG: F0F1 ATP synthase subunit gamma, partial [Pyrinomonadaceae bacterium]|nr:F0F1 ATP synthase subunit gamma [Phycisphaerales bacterium]